MNRKFSNTLQALFTSRKFLLALFALVQSITLHYFDVPDEIWQAINVVITVLIASIAIEDSAEKVGRTEIKADVTVDNE